MTNSQKIDELWQIARFGRVAPKGWEWWIRSDNGQGLLRPKPKPKPTKRVK